MGRLLGEAYVTLTAEEVARLRRELLTDSEFIWVVGTDAIPKFDAIFRYVERQISIAGDIEVPDE
jgi:nicotinic acid mononucleotide adenylyltransferase